MNHYSVSTLRIVILLIVSLCITNKSIAMVTEFSLNTIPTISAHCLEMMGDVHTSSPDVLSHQDKNSCGNHYACLGLEIESTHLLMMELHEELNAALPISIDTNRITIGYFALPDPPPRYTL